MDPNHDGKFDDGVDGFRLDHMMDNLDNKTAIASHLFNTFWNPLFGKFAKVNPKDQHRCRTGQLGLLHRVLTT